MQSADPKEIIKKFIDSAAEEYKNVAMIIQAIAVSSVKHSCESVLELFVSRYENHFDDIVSGFTHKMFTLLIPSKARIAPVLVVLLSSSIGPQCMYIYYNWLKQRVCN